MQKLLSGISTVALLATGFASTAVADDKNDNRHYIGLQVGMSRPADVTFKPTAAELGFETNWAQGIKVGYKWTNYRAEVEFNDYNSATKYGPSPTGGMDAQTLMFNVFYDMDMGKSWHPYIGAGIGGRWSDFTSAQNGGFSVADETRRKVWQGIAGVGYDLSDNVVAGLDYRYISAFGNGDWTNTSAGTGRMEMNQHAVFVGLNFFIGKQGSSHEPEVYTAPERMEPAPVVEQEPAPVYAPAPEPEPEPEPIVMMALPGDHIIYFGFDSAELDWEAQNIVASVVAAFMEHGSASLSLFGHTDRAGAATYNETLAQKRVDAVMAALVEAGVDAAAVSTSSHGEKQTAVKTADGKSNAKNRRVEVTFSLAN